MEDTLYDEFGNYIGPALMGSAMEHVSDGGEGEEEKREEEDEDRVVSAAAAGGAAAAVMEEDEHRIVLHEDKQYYPDAEKVFPEGTQILIEDDDRMDITIPIVARKVIKNFDAASSVHLRSTTTAEGSNGVSSNALFVKLLMQNPALFVRNIALVGHLHHGKTTFLDMLVEKAFGVELRDQERDSFVQGSSCRFTDSRKDEQERRMSIKSTPISLVLPDLKSGKNHLLNIIDCPGHVNFADEVSAALRVSDGIVLVVDAVEGVLMNTELVIRHAVENRLAVTLVISKMDRLIHELKLPPNDAYLKIRFIIQEVNRILRIAADDMGKIASLQDSGPAQRQHYCVRSLSPTKGNVCFSAGENGAWCFTLQSFTSQIYVRKFGVKVDPETFAKHLWGDFLYDEASHSFVEFSSERHRDKTRSFVKFILEPLYKIYAHVLGEEPEIVARTILPELGISLSKKELHRDPQLLLRIVLSRFLGPCTSGFVEMCLNHIPNPAASAMIKTLTIYPNSNSDKNSTAKESVRKALTTCDPNGPLMIQIVKLYSNTDASSFHLFGRVMSGTIRSGQPIRILGEKFDLESGSKEDLGIMSSVGVVYVPQGRSILQVDEASAGNWVILLNEIEPLDAVVTKTATITDTSTSCEKGSLPFHPLKFYTQSVMKLAIEPLKPSELPKMLHGLRCVNKSYPLLATIVEESGEHVILGTGELYLDCVMRDLREMYADIEIKVSDPGVTLRETVTETSAYICKAVSTNEKYKISMIAEPLERGVSGANIAEDIELGHVQFGSQGSKGMSNFFRKRHGWDIVAARSIWAFGPIAGVSSAVPLATNILMNETDPSTIDKNFLSSARDNIVQGFHWATREGPLCAEPIRNASFKVLDASSSAGPLFTSIGQMIPTTRRVLYSSFLTATPRLMEPIYRVEVVTPRDLVSSIKKVFSRRRGHASHESPVPGTPFTLMKGFIPVLDSFGFECDLRAHTNGMAFCLTMFDHYEQVPGDPLDSTITLQPLEPAPPDHLGRELLVKTRRRKGLSDEVNVSDYLDE